MNIDDISRKPIAPGALHPAKSAKSPAVSPKTKAQVRQSEVKVNMSRLTCMMSDNSDELTRIHEVRQDKIAEYRNNLDDDIEFSDKQIDSILRKMIVA